MIKKLLPYLFILTFHLVGAQNTLTLEQIIDVSLENNYSIKIARNNNDIASNNHSLGNAGFLPEVTLDYDKNFGTQSFDQLRSNGGELSNSGVKNSRQTYGANLDWTIFDGLQMFTTYDQLEVIKLQSEESLKADIELLIFNIKTTFYLTALETERLNLYDSNVILSEQRLQVAKDKYELGKASKLEYLQAQVDLNADKSVKIQQRQVLAARKLELIRLMAFDVDSIDFSIIYTLENEQEIKLIELLGNLEIQNPRLIALKREQVIASYSEKISQGDRLPSLSVYTGYTHTNSESPAGFTIENISNDVVYGLTASWTIFNGFNTSRQVQNAKIQHENAALQYKDELLNFSTNLKTRYLDYTNSLELMALERENLSVAKENNEISKERYLIGLSSSIELREAQLNFLNAELRFQNAAFNAKLASVELEYLSGSSSK